MRNAVPVDAARPALLRLMPTIDHSTFVQVRWHSEANQVWSFKGLSLQGSSFDMALDHYISQVYLRRFLAPELGHLLHGIRKSDLKRFTPRPKDICRLDEGNTNDFLSEPRAIEGFLVPIEGGFNSAVDMLSQGKPDTDCVYKIAGMASYILSCSPAAQRINAAAVEKNLENIAILADREAAFEAPPESLAGKDLTELIKKGLVTFKVDPKMIQAIGVSNILGRVAAIGNQHWEILHNEHQDCPFFTSDFPMGVAPDVERGVVDRMFPLSRNVAVKFCPNPRLRGANLKFSFEHFSFAHVTLSRAQAVGLNSLFAQCAEDLVLTSSWQRWTEALVTKSRSFRVVCKPTKIKLGGKWVDALQQAVGSTP